MVLKTMLLAALITAASSTADLDRERVYAFHDLLQEGNLGRIRLALEAEDPATRKMLVNRFGKRGRKPLQIAVETRDYELARLMLEMGAEPWVEHYDSMSSSLERAVATDDVRMADLLLRNTPGKIGGEVYPGLRFGEVASATMAELLIEHGADVNDPNGDGIPPLCEATHGEVVRVLLSHGADPQVRGRYGRSPLHCAADAESVRLLVKAGIPVDVRDDSGGTPLFGVCMPDEVIRELVRQGADTGARDNNGNSPLHRVWCRSSVELLCEWGADVNARNIAGETPLMAAWVGYDEEWDTIGPLIERGADIRALDNLGRNVFFRAAAFDSEKMRIVLDAGLEPDFRDPRGRTLLMLAEDDKAAQNLLNRGADVHARDASGATALHWSMVYHRKALPVLLERGASLNARDNNGLTPYEWLILNDAGDPHSATDLQIPAGVRVRSVTELRSLGVTLPLTLLDAVRCGNDGIVRRALKDEPRLDACSAMELLLLSIHELAEPHDLSVDILNRYPEILDSKMNVKRVVHASVGKGHLGVLKAMDRLLPGGLSPESAGRDSLESLYSMAPGTIEALAYLSAHGFDLSMRPERGETITDALCGRQWQSPDLKAIRQLRELGAPYSLGNAIAVDDATWVRDHLRRNPGALVELLGRNYGWASWQIKRTGPGTMAVLMGAGLDPEMQDKYGVPLVFEMLSSRQDTFLYLLGKGVKVTGVTDSGDTVLHYIDRDTRTETVEALIRAGVDVSARGKRELTPAGLALEYGREDIAELLVAHGGRLFDSVKAAISRDSTALVEPYLEQAIAENGPSVIDQRDGDGSTPLMWATWGGHEANVNLLLEYGADAHAANKGGSTVLHFISDETPISLVETLLRSGADPNRPDLIGSTAITQAKEFGRLPLLPIYKRFGGDVPGEWLEEMFEVAPVSVSPVRREAEVEPESIDAVDDYGRTALHRAAMEADAKRVEELIAAGADVNVPDHVGRTPLHFAVEKGSLRCTQRLLEAGADASIRDLTNNTPLAIARQRGDRVLMNLLEGKEAGDSPESESVSSSHAR